MTRLREIVGSVGVWVGFTVFAIAATYPQVRGATTSVPDHSDPYFSMWRLGWVAHELPRAPLRVFDANIFHPEPHTLGYSDAMLLPGAALAPFYWMGIEPVAIYNGALLAAFLLSAVATASLAHRLTGSPGAGMIAGAIYAFAPYRFDHYAHLELQIVFWLPLALSLVHRIVSDGRMRDGVAFGAVVGAQALSSIYAAIFFVTYCAGFVPLLAWVARARPVRLVRPFLAAAAVASIVAAPYAVMYARARATVGSRDLASVALYSATWSNYLAAPPGNRLYGSALSRLGADELYLFPGFTAIALGLLGLCCARGRVRLAYLGGLILAVELSRGVNGVLYPFLYEYLLPFRALRVPARVGILVNLSLAVLAAYGSAWLLEKATKRSTRLALTGGALALLLAEYASAPRIDPAPSPSLVDSYLARHRPVVIVQLPMTHDWHYMYQGIAHRQRMLNGYSGFAPDSYHETRLTMRAFPDDRSIAYLRARGVDYVILRGNLYQPNDWEALLASLRTRTDLSYVATFPAGRHGDVVYEVREPPG